MEQGIDKDKNRQNSIKENTIDTLKKAEGVPIISGKILFWLIQSRYLYVIEAPNIVPNIVIAGIALEIRLFKSWMVKKFTFF